MECRRTIGQIVLPVFYDVEPSDVRKQRNSFADAFDKHEKVQSPEKVQMWREALIQATGISGWHSYNFPDDYELIQKLVEDVHSQLHPLEIPDAMHDLVGVGSRVEEVISVMDLTRDEVRVVGIHGKSGIGKTLLSELFLTNYLTNLKQLVFLMMLVKFPRSTESTIYRKFSSLKCFKLRNVKITSTSEGMNIIMRRFRHLKVLIVLDDVDHANQLEALAGNRKWFGAGSRVIITTEDGELLPKYGADGVYKVNGLSYNEAKQLFRLHAFGNRAPGDLRKHLVGPICCIFRLPAPLKAWASLVRGRDIAWKDIFKTLKPIGSFLKCCVLVAQLIFAVTVITFVVKGFASFPFASFRNFPAFPPHPRFPPFPENP